MREREREREREKIWTLLQWQVPSVQVMSCGFESGNNLSNFIFFGGGKVTY